MLTPEQSTEAPPGASFRRRRIASEASVRIVASLPEPPSPDACPAATTAPAPSATTEYAPLDRPGLAKASSSTSVAPPSLPQPDATATDEISTAALAAGAVEQGADAPAVKPAVPELVPHGSLVPLSLTPNPNPTFDVNAVVKDANGNDIFDVDIDALEDKPWRQTGANMADYFNYGMNEVTWKNYVRKQREMRATESVASNPFVASPPFSLPLWRPWNRILTPLAAIAPTRRVSPTATSRKPGPTSRARTRPSSSRPSWASNRARCPRRRR